MLYSSKPHHTRVHQKKWPLPVLLALLFVVFIFTNIKTPVSDAQIISDACQTEDRTACLTLQVLSIAQENPSTLKSLFQDFADFLKDGTLTDDPRIFSPIIHDLGMELAFQKIPPEEAFALCPLNFKAGCLHGVTMGYLDEVENSDPLTLASFCDFAKTDPFTYKNCIHGVGHELTAKSQASLNEIVAQCKVLDTSLLSACASGVFMEYSTGVNGLGHHTHEAQIGSIILPCEEVDSEFKSTCYSSLTSYRQYVPEVESFQETALHCENALEMYKESCMLGLAEKIYTANAEDLKRAENTCETLSSLQESCVLSLETIKALESVL